MAHDSHEIRPDHRPPWWIAWLIALVPFGFLTAKWNFVCDDAYISFRYAKHLAGGLGLRFNLGVEPPVEGYTNFLWVVWISLFERASIDPALASRVTSILCGAILLAFVARVLHRRFGLAPLDVALGTLFLATLAPFAMWSTGGLATMPTALAVFLVWERLTGRSPRGVQAGIAAVAAGLLRADGTGFVLLVVGGVFVTSYAKRDRERARAALAAFALLALGVGAHVLWRHSYYGDWLPNTAYVKGGFSELRLERGAKYVASFLLAVPACLLALALAPIAWRRGRRALLFQIACVVLGTLGYSVYVGGDFMPLGRFLMPMVAFLAVLVGLLLERFRRAGRALAAGLIGLSFLSAFDVQLVPRAWREPFHFRWNTGQYVDEFERWADMQDKAETWVKLGRSFAEVARGMDESIIIANAGAVPYFTDLFVYDNHGLVTRDVARRDAPPRRRSPGHDKSVGSDHFFDRNPTYLGAIVVPAGAPRTHGLPANWDQRDISKRVDVETHTVPDVLGQTEVLRVLRFRRD